MLTRLSDKSFLLTDTHTNFLVVAVFWFVVSPAHAATYTVNSTGDTDDATPGDSVCETVAGNGVCTLRAAIQEVNAGTGGDTIIFHEADGGCSGNRCTTTLTSALPHLTVNATVDATTQPGTTCGDLWSGTPAVWNIFIDANHITNAGLQLFGTDTVKGLEVGNVGGHDLNGYAVAFFQAGGVAQCNYVHDSWGGIGTFTLGFGGSALLGGPNPGDGNLSNANHFGMTVYGDGNTMEGNFIGVDVTGSIAVPNAAQGIYVEGGDSNIINHNLSSANAGPGIFIKGTACAGGSNRGNSCIVDSDCPSSSCILITNTVVTSNTFGFNRNGVNTHDDMCNNIAPSGGVQILDYGRHTTQSNNDENTSCDPGCAVVTAGGDCAVTCAGLFSGSSVCLDGLFTSLASCQSALDSNCGPGCTCTVYNSVPSSCANGCSGSATPSTPMDTATQTNTPTNTPTNISTETATPTTTGAPTATPTVTGTLTVTPTLTSTPVLPCPSTPVAGCRTPRRSTIALTNKPLAHDDALYWQWGRGAHTERADFGDPLHTTGYSLCVYDTTNATPHLAMTAVVSAGGTCGTSPCWKQTSLGFRYQDRNKSADGLFRIALRSGVDGKASIVVTGRGPNLPLPTSISTTQFLHEDSQVIVQLLKSDGGVCWEARYPAPAVRNTSTTFKAKSP